MQLEKKYKLFFIERELHITIKHLTNTANYSEPNNLRIDFFAVFGKVNYYQLVVKYTSFLKRKEKEKIKIYQLNKREEKKSTLPAR